MINYHLEWCVKWRMAILENVFTFSSCGVNSRKQIQCPAGTARAEAPGLSEAREKAEAVPAESAVWNGTQN